MVEGSGPSAAAAACAAAAAAAGASVAAAAAAAAFMRILLPLAPCSMRSPFKATFLLTERHPKHKQGIRLKLLASADRAWEAKPIEPTCRVECCL